jgi:hypothetical protein
MLPRDPVLGLGDTLQVLLCSRDAYVRVCVDLQEAPVEETEEKVETTTKTAEEEEVEERVTALLWARQFMESFGSNVKVLWSEASSPLARSVLTLGVILAAPVALAISGLLGVAGAVRVGSSYVQRCALSKAYLPFALQLSAEC